MKKTAFCQVLLALLMLLACGGPLRAQGTLVSLDLREAPLETAIQRIKQQTDYLFVNMNVDTKQPVTVHVERKGIEAALDAVFTPIHVDWKIEGTTIVIAPKVIREAQPSSRTVRGRIQDAAGEPVIGGAVMVKGTTIGASTDLDGNFEFALPAGYENGSLEFSSLGYRSLELPIGTRNVFNVTLNEENEVLEGTVVTALGIRREQKALSYNVQEVNADQLLTGKDANFVNSLSGKVAGLVLNASSAGVGGATKAVMRGVKSISKNNNAIYVIDGVPMTATVLDASTEFGSSGQTDPIADINPEDIESISVLTGAAAAALYGSTAANGAIVVNTKKGSAEKTQITFSSNTELSRVATLPLFQNRYGTGDYNSAEGSVVRSYGLPLVAENNYGYDPRNDYFQYGLTGTETVSLSTGNNKNQTYLSASAVNNRGIVPNTAYNRYNAKFRNTTKFYNDKVTLDVSAEYILQDHRNMRNQGLYNNPIVGAYLFPRGGEWDDIRLYERWDSARKLYTQYWPVGDAGITMQNPYWINYRNLSTESRKRYVLGGSLSWDITDWLTASGRVRVDNSAITDESKNYASTNTQLTGGSLNGSYSTSEMKDRQTYADALLSADKRFGEWSLSGQFGASVKDMYFYSMGLGGPIADTKLANKFFLGMLDQSQMSPSQSDAHQQVQSIYGQAEIGWKGAYYLTVTDRRDWDSALFGPLSTKHSFHYPSAGLSVVLSQAFGMPKSVELLKVRGSYARVGSAFERFIANPQHSYSVSTASYATNASYPLALKPEYTSSWEAGLQARLAGGLSLDATWYYTHTKDQTFDVALSAGSGYDKAYIQTGDILNTGFEVALGYSHTWGIFTWNSNYTFSTNRNKIVSLAGNAVNPVTGEELSIENLPKGGLGNARFYLTEGGTLGDLYSRADLKRDSNNAVYVDEKGGIATENLSTLDDMIKLGSVLPKANMAWRNDFRIGNVSLSALFSARLGGIVYSNTQAKLDWYGVSAQSADARDAGGVLVNGSDLIDANKWFTAIAGGDTVPQFYTYSATNVRLQEASVGYTIPRKALGNLFDVTLQIVGRNLWMIYCKAPFDPESVATATNTFYQGIDYFMTPNTRNVGFNIRLNF
jgi:TonB-linked outer membrane protein, SusC/RagA family